jgi:hypothetical protein
MIAIAPPSPARHGIAQAFGCKRGSGRAIPPRSSTIQLHRMRKLRFRFDCLIRKHSSLDCVGKKICSSYELIFASNLY